MADRARALPENAAGDLYVDASCIDCDTCRWMAPETFDRRGSQSRVHRQPVQDEPRRRALMAALACPTTSIGTEARAELAAAAAAFPDPIDEVVSHCGFHSEASFGATSYLLRRPQGNVLVDSPRFAGPLVRRLHELGGVAWMFLTHRDDVADHARFAAEFGCQRVLHEADLTPDTRDVERVVRGADPVALADDLLVIPTPGHTAGSACLLHDERHLFTGDHLAFSPRLQHLYGFRGACWYDWKQVVASTRRLARLRFNWVLPGHGRRAHFSPDALAEQFELCLDWMATA